MEAALRVALYARVSTSDGRQGVENQLEELRKFSATQGWLVSGEYVDHESGGRADRVEFRRIFVDAAQRKFDVVLFWALDRLTREGARETLEYLNRLSVYGVAFRSFQEPYLDSCGAFQDAVVAILGAVAKQEKVRISERVRAGLSRVRAEGTRSGRPIGRPRAVFRRDEAIELRRNGLSWRQVASKLRVGMTTVRRACQSVSIPCQNPHEGNV